MMPVNEKFYTAVGAEQYGKDADKLLYNGPFYMESWEHEVGLVLKKNKDYYKANEVKVGGIDIRIVKESETALNMFLAGDLDMVGLRGKQIETVEDEGFTVQHYGDGATFYLEFNTREKIGDAVNPISNKYIRQALSYALDRKGYIDTVLKNASLPATSFTTPEISGKTKATFPEEFATTLVKDNDGAAAKEALDKGLAELGMKKEDLKISMLCDDTDTAKETGAYYKECWTRNLGIDVEILIMPFKSRLEKTQNNDFMMSSSGWGPDYNDPMTFLDMFETGNGNNHTGYSSAAYDDLLKQVRNEVDPSKKYDLYFQLETMLMDDMPIAPIYWRNRDFTTIDELKGVVRNALQDCTLVWAYFE
jgi:oligopeptide transport system substrate-binding protein